MGHIHYVADLHSRDVGRRAQTTDALRVGLGRSAGSIDSAQYETQNTEGTTGIPCMGAWVYHYETRRGGLSGALHNMSIDL